MRRYLKEKAEAAVNKQRLNAVGGSAALDSHLSAKFGTKIQQPVAVGQSV
jgi:hypothetical protein